ncbi:RidA family protein [Parahaliea mediterranea]|uniref:RidA family protein n=1 Tax=Parahaliea mediterranea TaxID=651086 RepID=UPI00321BED5B
MKKYAVGDEVFLPSGTVAPFSEAYISGSLVFISGQLAFDKYGELNGGKADEQTLICLANIDRILSKIDLTAKDIIKVTAWLTDPEDFADFNKAYVQYFGSHRPSRSTVCSGLMLPGARVEIEAIAAV